MLALASVLSKKVEGEGQCVNHYFAIALTMQGTIKLQHSTSTQMMFGFGANSRSRLDGEKPPTTISRCFFKKSSSNRTTECWPGQAISACHSHHVHLIKVDPWFSPVGRARPGAVMIVIGSWWFRAVIDEQIPTAIPIKPWHKR